MFANRCMVHHFFAKATSENVSKAISAVCRGPPGPAARTADLSAILNFRDYLEENDASQHLETSENPCHSCCKLVISEDLIYKPEKGRGNWTV